MAPPEQRPGAPPGGFSSGSTGLPAEGQALDRIAVLVWGLSNAGKSTFVNWVAEYDKPGSGVAKVGKNLGSTTEEVQELELTRIHRGRRVLLIDTPGMEHTHIPDADVTKKIDTWLDNLRSKRVTVGAVIYLLDVSCDVSQTKLQTDIDMLKSLCGSESSLPVAVATTKWGRVLNDGEGEIARETTLKSLWGLGEPARVHNQKSAVDVFEKVLKKAMASDTPELKFADSRDAKRTNRSSLTRTFAKALLCIEDEAIER
ncbi:hypothetical protein NMY22_g10835 [Coprinellus aureogranulatus]|nr:hypothetical protein NMY22_g10835 [Coprinellus aureogranulatus]